MDETTIVQTKTKGYVYVDTSYTMDRGWETMVFKSDENGEITDWEGLDSCAYADESEANEGHSVMIKKWENM